eukprot:TRINITY_DN973_c0_g2_i1.p1 TRINITY_DN973_c0_g2~~TRINITY_DN973_c0_g2_i1.p1  ORF type:complete len:437 (+),score=139.01 TRINITY_DN973_c0_g2_i1:288-1598(+)
MGTTPLNSQRSRAHFPTTDFFNKPKANLLFFLNSNHVGQMKTFSGETQTPILRETYPAQTVSNLVTMLSGHTPSSHGIIANQWKDAASSSKIEANSEWDTAGSFSSNLQDMFTLTFGGRSLVISAAGAKDVARSLSAKPFTLPANSNNYGVYLRFGQNATSVYAKGNGKFSITYEQISEIFGGETVEGEQCSLSMNKDADFGLLAEVAFVEYVVRMLNADHEINALTTDDAPDMFSFGFTALNKIEAVYGADSAEMKCALNLVDSTMSKAIEGIKSIYGGKILAEAVVVSPNGDKISTEVADRLRKAVPAGLVEGSNIKKFYPNLYLTESISSAKKERLCASISNALVDLDMEAVCMPEPAFAMDAESMKVMQSIRADSGNETSEAAIFQIVLWSSIGMIGAVAFGSYFMFTIDPSTDTLLYSHDINHPNPKFGNF